MEHGALAEEAQKGNPKHRAELQMTLRILSLKAKEEKQQSVLVPNAKTKHPDISNTIMLHTRSYEKKQGGRSNNQN